MRRREFIAGLGSAAAWPVVSRAQQPVLPVIGYLGTQSADDDYKNFTVPFLQGLKETGYVEGRNVAIEYRWAESQADRLPALAGDLVRRRVAVIVVTGIPAAIAAKEATTTIPIVFATGEDPVEMDLVASLNRPGGNLTGQRRFNKRAWAETTATAPRVESQCYSIRYSLGHGHGRSAYRRH
jgi:putative ABC transport system substrate-binding protein